LTSVQIFKCPKETTSTPQTKKKTTVKAIRKYTQTMMSYKNKNIIMVINMIKNLQNRLAELKNSFKIEIFATH
jgi:hypothetical protein